MAKFRKIKKIYDQIIGTATVVSPELIINKNWNPDNETADTIMKVPAKNFYDYLGNWIAPDSVLRSDGDNKGLGLGPYNNELNRALDKTDIANNSPGSIVSTIETFSDGVDIPFKMIDNPNQDWSLTVSSTRERNTGITNADKDPEDYTEDACTVGLYNWEGTWGDIENGFETAVDVEIDVRVANERVPGNISGNKCSTGSTHTIWIGNNEDVKDDKTLSYRNQNTASFFFNPYFSTGFVPEGENVTYNKKYVLTIHRKPFENTLRVVGVGEARGGRFDFELIAFGPSNPISWMNVGIGPFSLNIGDFIWSGVKAIFAPVFDAINGLLNLIFGLDVDGFRGSVDAHAAVISTTKTTLDKTQIIKHPAYKYFQSPPTYNPIDYHAFLYTQYYFPYFDQSPFYPYRGGGVINLDAPYLQNEIVENTRSRLANSQIPTLKKYQYFVPNLFRLLFETKIGVFYEQLAKQLKDVSGTGVETNFNIKLLETESPVANVEIRRTSQDKCLFDIMYPTDETVWNNYLANTGWPDDAKTSNLNFLKNFIPEATIAATPTSYTSTVSEYDSAITDYNIGSSVNLNEISAINDVIGKFSEMKNIFDKGKSGYDVNTWTTLCSDTNVFKTLSTGTPKNLSYKIVEFILWYLEPNGISEELRSSVNSLVNYEKIIDQDIENRNAANVVDETGNTVNHRNYHIIGTKIYDRECK